MRWSLAVVGLLAAATIEAPAVAEPWTPIASRGVFRSAHVSARLASGKILLAGGQYEPCLSLADLFDPKTLTFAETAPMKEGRGYFCAVPIDGGKRVFVAGGTTTQVSGGLATGARSTAEIYDESTNAWTLAKPMSSGRNNQFCGALPDGRVLVVAGTGDPAPALSTVEIYDPKTDAWSGGPPLPMELEATRGATLPGGDLFVIGGGSAFRWSSTASTWISPGPAHTLPTKARLAALADGRVLVMGIGTPVIYDGSAKSWTDVAVPKDVHIGASFAQLPGNKLLVAGGFEKLVAGAKPLASVEIFDGASNTWVDAPPMLIGRATHTMDAIDPGRVIVVGGPALAAEEVWNALPGVACTSDAQCGSGACVDGRCCDKACGGVCEACDVPGKEGICSPIDGAPRDGHATCAPYLSCAAGACASSCATDAECASGDVCFATLKRCGPARGLCKAEGYVVSPSGQVTDCSPYVCGPSGECLASCGTTLDCASGFACDEPSKTCVQATPRDPGSSGGCASSAKVAGTSFGWLLVVAVAIARRRRKTAGLLAAIAILALSRRASADPWRPTRPMTFAGRLFVPVTRLTDGRILVAGGSPNGDVSSAELYDVATDLWTVTTKSMSVPHSGHAAALLADGRVLIIGGHDAAKKPIAAVEIFDPTTSSFTNAPPIPTPRLLSLAIALTDGRVLVAGGVGAGNKGLTDAQLFDPKSSTWTSAGTMGALHASGGIALLPDGRAMVVGGAGGKKVDLFDPAGNTWSAGPETAAAHADAQAIALPDGRVVVVGGSAVAEVFDPKTNAWSELASGLEVRYSASATLLPTGEILIVGGSDSAGDVLSQTSEILDPAAKKVRKGPRLPAPRATQGAAVLADGRTILVGGISTNDDTVPIVSLPVIFELEKGSPCREDRDCDSSFCTDGRCCATRCKEACNACDLEGSVGTCGPIDGRPRKDHATCAPFGACIAGGCASICGSDDYCDADHVCDVESGSCVEPKSKCEGADAVDLSSGERKSCAPYACARGKCASRCATTDECTGGAICDQGSCTTGVPPVDSSGGCVYGTRAGSGAFGLVALAAIRTAQAIRRRLRAKPRPPCPTRI
jgi:hypothetical protein